MFKRLFFQVGPMALVGLAIVQLQIPVLRQLQQEKPPPSLAEINRELAREKTRLSLWRQMPALGFDNLLANWVFLQFHQYFGDIPVREQTGYTLSPEYFEIIVDRDPRFLGAYVSLSTSISLYSGQPERSVRLISQGLKSMTPQVPPQSFTVWRIKAIDQLLFLGDAMGARQSFLQAAAWAAQSPDPDAQIVAAVSAQTARFLERNPQSRQAQVMSWSQVFHTATDQKTRNIARDRLTALGAEFATAPDGSILIKPPTSD